MKVKSNEGQIDFQNNICNLDTNFHTSLQLYQIWFRTFWLGLSQWYS